MRCGGVLLVLCGASVCARIDQLFRARCTASCIDAKNKNECESECSLLTQTKPGQCPPKENMTWYEGGCLHSCSQDVDCPATDKCCVHNCGTTCQHAVGLDHEPGLPSIPVNLTVTDAQRQRCKLVQWSPSVPRDKVFYVLQERRHAGLELQPKLFGTWKSRSRRRKNRFLLTGLKPAHWYQIRVASVNGMGSKGYSLPSQPFKLKIDPSRPEEPQNLTVSRPGWVEGRLWAELHWKRPFSDLPLDHYKVFWSHCVKSEVHEKLPSKSFCKPMSVIVNHRTINYKNTDYILKDLEPHSLYFIQVQAITIPYGSRKLTSEKAAAFIDTIKHKNATNNWRGQPDYLVKNLRISGFYRASSEKLETKVIWDSSPGRFLISWGPDKSSCEAITNNPSYEAITEAFHYNIDHLAFNCKYQVIVNAIGSARSSKITFTTPHCTEVNPRLPCL